ncbi:uncharacterized protein G2W53_030655 [Senna tora]|uniref:Uncharacterized protein n=1 Tax=Senna tora TaxID=362788 RepID=A0A834T7V1_9FABA|nr:uncharacterized protein G2W53_030655 [Senna tora]
MVIPARLSPEEHLFFSLLLSLHTGVARSVRERERGKEGPLNFRN